MNLIRSAGGEYFPTKNTHSTSMLVFLSPNFNHERFCCSSWFNCEQILIESKRFAVMGVLQVFVHPTATSRAPKVKSVIDDLEIDYLGV
jgi:hypothetical protein